MSLVQEPITFTWKNTSEAPRITLLINPEMLTINFKKIITKVRTKSRIVSFYYGQEPLNFTYQGQTGNLYPSNEIRESFKKDTSQGLDTAIKELEDQLDTLDAQQLRLAEQIERYDPNFSKTIVQGLTTNYDDIQKEIDTKKSALNALREGTKTTATITSLGFGEKYIVDNVLTDLSHTEILNMSPKFKLFKALQQFYDDSQTATELIRVVYRDNIYDGYFDSFSFTDSAKDSWNWKYSLAFTVLSWEKATQFSNRAQTTEEKILVQDEGTLTRVVG